MKRKESEIMRKMLGLTFILLVVLGFTQQTVVAVTPASKTLPTGVVTDTQMSADVVSEYVLPYPGILPDHPLYFVKFLRDKILEFLIVDEVRKLEFFILLADKHVAMTMELVQKGNLDLAGIIMTRGIDYFDKALITGKSYEQAGKIIPEHIKERLSSASNKYIEVLNSFELEEDADFSDRVKSEVIRIQKLQSEI